MPVRDFVLTAIIALLLAVSPLRAQSTIGELRTYCLDLVNEKRTPFALICGAFFRGWWMGYMAGHEGGVVMSGRETGTVPKALCLEKVSPQMAAAAFVNWANQHPDKWNAQFLNFMVDLALLEKWPCK